MQDLETINELHKEFTELLEDLMEDLPYSQEGRDNHSEYAAERALFINEECESLCSEASRLQLILCWQGRLLQRIYDHVSA